MDNKRTIEEIRKDLEQAKKRFLDMVKYGDAACSKYDLSLGYDADFYLNRVSLLANHIKYHNQELREALKYGEQGTLTFE